jgi:hypothetical protein
MSCLEASFYKKAFDNEIESIMNKHTWELVYLPLGKPLAINGSSKGIWKLMVILTNIKLDLLGKELDNNKV